MGLISLIRKLIKISNTILLLHNNRSCNIFPSFWLKTSSTIHGYDHVVFKKTQPHLLTRFNICWSFLKGFFFFFFFNEPRELYAVWTLLWNKVSIVKMRNLKWYRINIIHIHQFKNDVESNNKYFRTYQWKPINYCKFWEVVQTIICI